jgi:hypothetical protein
MKIFREIVIGKFALRFYPSDTGWMCGIGNEMMDGLEQRPWIGLTRDEQSFVYSNLHNATSREDSFWVDFANAIEAKLREVNT